MYNSAELTAYELAHLRLIDEARRAQLEVQLLDLVAGREGGHKGHRGFWLPEGPTFMVAAAALPNNGTSLSFVFEMYLNPLLSKLIKYVIHYILNYDHFVV